VNLLRKKYPINYPTMVFENGRYRTETSDFGRKHHQLGEREILREIVTDIEFHDLVVRTDRSDSGDSTHENEIRPPPQKPHNAYVRVGKNMTI
jgi:hypothetical protein